MNLKKENLEIREKINKKYKKEMEYVKEAENFLEDLISVDLKESWAPTDNFLLILREWNSYYPSFYDINGGCYVICVDGTYTIIDPGYKTLRVLRENHIETRFISNIIITHNHGDHIGGILELIELLFRQNKNSKTPCRLYVNPGMLKVFEHYNSSALEIKEINCQSYNFLTISENLLFKAYPVPHSGIGLTQQSIALKFKYLHNEKEYIFCISGDLDGDPKYLNYYKEIFCDLNFIILHLGSFKFKEPSNKDKHLYIDGILQFILNTNQIQAYFIQEFGLEMKSPRSLCDDLSDVLFDSGFYFPLIILRRTDEVPELRENLFPYLMPRFFDILNRNKAQENKKNIIEFCNLLCLEYKNQNYYLHNFWDNPIIKSILENTTLKKEYQQKWSEIIAKLKNMLYFGIESPDYNKLYVEFSDFINKFSISWNCMCIIKDNIFNLVELCFNIKIEQIESFLSFDFWITPGDYRDTFNDFLNLSYFPYYNPEQYDIPEDKNEFFWLKYIPLIIFIFEYIFRILNTDFKKHDEFKDIRKELITFLSEESKKKVFLGEYKKMIDFQYLTEDKIPCNQGEKWHLFDNPKNGEYYGVDGKVLCPNCKNEYEYEQDIREEANSQDQSKNSEDEENKARELMEQEENKEKLACEEKSRKLNEFIINSDFVQAKQLINDIGYIYSRNIAKVFWMDIETITLLIDDKNRDNKDLTDFILLLFFKGKGWVSFDKPELLNQLVKKFYVILEFVIEKSNIDKLSNLITIISDIVDETLNLYPKIKYIDTKNQIEIWEEFIQKIISKFIIQINSIFSKIQKPETINGWNILFNGISTLYDKYPDKKKYIFRKILLTTLDYPQNNNQLYSLKEKFVKKHFLMQSKSDDEKIYRIFGEIEKKKRIH